MGNHHGIMRPRRLKSARATGEEGHELGSYEQACNADPELRSFDAALRRRASLAVSAAASGVEVRSMSLGSLREVTGCLVEMNQEVVRVVLASKQDVWGCPELLALVEDYFDASLHTHDFLAALDKALRRACDSQLVLHLALQVQDPAIRPARALGALRRFKEAAGGEPFTDEFFAAFQAAYRQQLGMLDGLRRQKRRLDRRLRSLPVF